MGFAHFLYGDWDAEEAATAAQDALIKACVAFESECNGGDEAQAVTSGQRKVWVACQELAAEDDDFDPQYIDGVDATEQFYRECFLRAYRRVVKRSYPKYETDGEGLAWWPEALKLDDFWPRRLLRRVAFVMGEIEAEQGIAVTRHFEAQQASAKD